MRFIADIEGWGIRQSVGRLRFTRTMVWSSSVISHARHQTLECGCTDFAILAKAVGQSFDPVSMLGQSLAGGRVACRQMRRDFVQRDVRVMF